MTLIQCHYFRDKMPPNKRAKGKKTSLGGALLNSSKNTRTQDLEKVTGGAFRHKDKHAHLDTTNYTSYQDQGVSITEQSDLQQFLNEAELSNRNFETERSRTRQLLFEQMNKMENGDNSDEEDYRALILAIYHPGTNMILNSFLDDFSYFNVFS